MCTGKKLTLSVKKLFLLELLWLTTSDIYLAYNETNPAMMKSNRWYLQNYDHVETLLSTLKHFINFETLLSVLKHKFLHLISVYKISLPHYCFWDYTQKVEFKTQVKYNFNYVSLVETIFILRYNNDRTCYIF